MGEIQRSPAEATANLRTFLQGEDVQRKLREAASKYMTAEDLTRFALIAISKTPDLANCSTVSVLRSLMDAAALGIQPGGLQGRGYLIPRWNKNTKALECSFDPGWRGLIDIARRSGVVRSIEAHVVYKGDKYKLSYGLSPTLEHTPDLDAGEDREIVFAYAVAFFADGSTQCEVITAAQLKQIEAASAASGGPWKGPWRGEMCRKSAVKRLCKYLPFDPVLERARTIDDEDVVTDATPALTADVAPQLPENAAPSRKTAARIRAKQAPIVADADGVIQEPEPATVDPVDAAEREAIESEATT